MDTFNTILWWINIAMIILIGFNFLFQLIFMLVCPLKPRKYKDKVDTYHDFTILIRAHNEEDVIAQSVDSALQAIYPKEKRHVVVFAHNCTDKTAEIAKAHGARVIEVGDKDPKHRTASWCMKLGMDVLKSDGNKYDYFLFLDADNQISENYILECNKAACSGVLLGKTFENSKNLTDNFISCMIGLWYIRDNFVASRGRSVLHLGCIMDGCASMVKAKYALEWDAMSTSDDIEFTLNRLLNDGLKVEYINNAMVFEDQPTTLKDVFNRNARMGNGLNKLFWTKGIACLERFFKTLFNPKVPFSLKMTYLDQYTNLAIIPSSLLCVIWFPFYYIYSLCYTGIVKPFEIPGLGEFGIWWFTIFIVCVLLVIFIGPFILQPALSAFVERKRLYVGNKFILVFSILFFPFSILIQAMAIFQGILSKPKWKKLKRSKTKIQN